MADAGVLVRGVDGSGSDCVEVALEHGADPRAVLADAGWEVVSLVSIGRQPGGEIELDFRVRRRRAHAAAAPVAPRVEVSAAEAAGAVRKQRVAAYAVVRSERGLLLTEFSARTARPGTWGLPGGGVEPGEEPDQAVVREVWEESGQHIRLEEPLDVLSQHWVGRAPDGLVEDFHAVRLVYRAWVEEPTDPVVHDVGGTTESAAWVEEHELAGLPVSPWVGALLAEPAR
ncbi:ADP-ribose pyrophosphatase YjhB (NUDIX family) [Barrientosiimonas humi]|uniref:ADP-ribose pyrophosphatase YjhB (NUDIX family) n=1 Tax=Barrientosiimonas humi TaxID=999931 RepID=A0A542XED3_9MICO|nr:NUDIX domain-containing protein [Barrientosiimonas humi]TQL34146.1 ADP-ribose pyrophosphatase YjhB (NUDIX family) [Barrientosiimonas humi]CAG7574138.1 Nucleoside triphosphatase NudI [Barrientosiimonas humi]